jgi:hypothetical protein
MYKIADICLPADKREFLRISQAVGMGFLIMGVIGYIVKLSKYNSYPFTARNRRVATMNTVMLFPFGFLWIGRKLTSITS